MSLADHPEFRLGNVLATSFTGTLSERSGTPVERIAVPSRLVDWLAIHHLDVDSCTEAQLAGARTLRESIHVALTAVATGGVTPEPSVRVLNSCSTGGSASALLTPEGDRRWRLATSSVGDALSVIAADAIEIVAGEREGKVALCASPTCRAAFLDSSRSRTRRWCDMNTCGNREKKARFLANRARSAAPTTG